jgi:hypothetical protein
MVHPMYGVRPCGITIIGWHGEMEPVTLLATREDGRLFVVTFMRQHMTGQTQVMEIRNDHPKGSVE